MMKETIVTFVLTVVGSFLVYLAPTYPLILMVGAFIVADTIFGVYASWYVGEKIISRKFARLITKLIIYTLAILLVYIFDTVLLSEFIDKPLLITKLGAGVLSFVEIFSMDEKLRKINNDKGIVYYVTKVFEFIKNIKDKYNNVIN